MSGFEKAPVPSRRGSKRLVLAALIAVSAAACEPYFDRDAADAGATGSSDSLASLYAGSGVGSTCQVSGTCRAGLVCSAGKCIAGHATAANGKCLISAECKDNFHCSWAGFCTPQPAGAQPAVAKCAESIADAKCLANCQRSADCAQGLWCMPLPLAKCGAGVDHCGACVIADAAHAPAEGETCSAASECPPAMVCEMTGLNGSCKKALGTGDLGAKCKASSECLAGLTCSPQRGECVPGSVLLSPDLFGGVECNAQAEATQAFSALMQLPRTGIASEFYALPFPSDVYRKGANLDLSRHPRPGQGPLGFDTLGRVIDAAAVDMTGYGLSTSVYLRFTQAIDPATLKTAPAVPAAQATVRLVNLKSGADVAIGAGDLQFRHARNKYICHNWLQVHGHWSELLEPDTTYAVVVSDGIRQACGNGKCEKALGEANASCSADCQPGELDSLKPSALNPPLPGADLPMLLSEVKPADLSLEAAWNAHSPLRAWLKGQPALKPVSAAVFTTADTRKTAQELVAAVAAATKPAFPSGGKPVLCTAATKSPCADPNWTSHPLAKSGARDPRDCPANADSLPFYEIHARLTLPVFQDGKRPYLTYSPVDAKTREGALHKVGGKPALVDYEDVCIALTIPKGIAKPAAGWPVLLFAHGTGGSFRSGAEAMAKPVSAISTAQGLASYATLAMDQPMHGARRGVDSAGKQLALDPGPLFYNFSNPSATLGNFWQGAADNYALHRWIKAYQGEELSGAMGKVTFDAAHVVFMGHSQGSTTGPMALPYMEGLQAAVLSGCGASLPHGLMGKKLPYDAAIGIQLGIQDLAVDAGHPALNLLQNYFEPADPLIYAPLINFKPALKPLHLLHTYGMGDSYTPASTSRIFAAAAHTTLGLPALVPNWLDKMEDLGVPSAALPLTAAAGKVLSVTLEAKNDPANSLSGAAYDGHFVAFQDKTLSAAVLQFLGSLAKGTATVPK
jgi:hypothetical protein